MSFQTLKAQTEQFLACHTIAVIGVSEDPKQPANLNFRTLRDAGYHAIPVNPKHDQVEGVKCYPSIESIPEKIEAVMIFTPAIATTEAAINCYKNGIKHIWIHGGFGGGSKSAAASQLLKDKPGLNFIDGACPMMFLQNADWFHHSVKHVMRFTGGLPV